MCVASLVSLFKCWHWMVSDPQIICVEKCRHYSVNVIFFYYYFIYFLFESFIRALWFVLGQKKGMTCG